MFKLASHFSALLIVPLIWGMMPPSTYCPICIQLSNICNYIAKHEIVW